MGWESSDVVRCYLEPLLQGQMRIAKLKSAYNSLGTSSLGSLLSRYREQNSGRYRGIYH